MKNNIPTAIRYGFYARSKTGTFACEANVIQVSISDRIDTADIINELLCLKRRYIYLHPEQQKLCEYEISGKT